MIDRRCERAGTIVWGVSLLSLFFIASSGCAVAQSAPVPPRGDYDLSIGIRIGGAAHDLSANIVVPTMGTDDSAACGFYQEGNGDAFDIGLIGSLRLIEWLAVDAGVVASFFDDRLAFPCVERADIRQPDGTLTSAETEFVRESSGSFVEAELGLRAKPVRTWPIWVGVIGRISVMQREDAEYHEEVVAPYGAVFPGFGEVRPIATRRNDVTTSIVTFGPSLSADIRVGERVRFHPQIAYLFDPSDLSASPSLRRNRFLSSLRIDVLFSTGNAHSTPLEPQGN